MRHDRASVYGAASASFRDPAGRVIEAGGRIVRLVERGHEAELLAALELPALGGFRTDGRVVGSRLMDRGEIRDLLEDEGAGEVLGDDIELALEHERIPFPSFAYEWSPAMLHAAAGLTLDLAEALLAEGFGLKDASPANVLFRGPRPVFVDVSSIERRDPHDPTWIPYGQFIRTFVMPLLLTKHLGLPLEQLTATRPDGLAPEEVYDYCGSVRRFLPPFLTVVSIPRWLRFAMPRTNPYRPRRVTDPAQARFIVGALLKQLRRLLRRVEPTGRVASRWSRYNDDVREERRGAQYV
ncbi:MAG: SAM-dependent methyltransferase, partial [Candidatus Rokuibacteriota bacterium]